MTKGAQSAERRVQSTPVSSCLSLLPGLAALQSAVHDRLSLRFGACGVYCVHGRDMVRWHSRPKLPSIWVTSENYRVGVPYSALGLS